MSTPSLITSFISTHLNKKYIDLCDSKYRRTGWRRTRQMRRR